jgi:seryl-tRNA synthetase
MADDPNNPGGGDPGKGGADPDNTGDKTELERLKAHNEKLLSEKKKEQAKRAEAEKKLAEKEKAEKEREEQELKDQNKWKEYATQKEKEAEEAKQKLAQRDAERADSFKVRACLENLDGSVESDYWHLFDIDKIKTHPETGEIDQASVTEVVEAFRQKHTRLIDKPGANSDKKLPTDAPIGDPNSTDLEEWKKLPLKEKKARLAVVYAANKDKL